MPIVDVITGGAGFVGVNLAARLVAAGRRPVLLDNLSGGRLAFLDALGIRNSVGFVKVDLSERDQVAAGFAAAAKEGEIGAVWHLCANSDISAGVADADIDFRNTFLPTHNTLAVMRDRGLKQICFSSTSAVYGDHGEEPISEDAVTRPISNYGAMKLASEAAICAACESFLTRASILRFPNVVGTPATHGVIFDFIRKLKTTPDRLDVLGDGTQRKPYLHASDLIDAILFVGERAAAKPQIVNIGPPDEGATVAFIAETVRNHISPGARIVYGEGPRGWVGDVPRFSYATDKLLDMGFGPLGSSRAAILRAVPEIAAQLAKAGS